MDSSHHETFIYSFLPLGTGMVVTSRTASNSFVSIVYDCNGVFLQAQYVNAEEINV